MTEPTTEQWRELHLSFVNYCQTEPWDWVRDDDVVAIEHPSGEYKGYCSVMRGGETEYGLAVFVGDEGLVSYLALVLNEVEPDSPDAFDRIDTLSVMLADRDDLDAAARVP